MSNNNSDLLDDGLQAVMGKDRCQNEWAAPKKESKKPRKDEAADASWEPVRADLNWYDRLKEAASGIIPPAGLCMFFFWCHLTERMDPTTAILAMFVCVAYAFFNVGRACVK